MAVYAYRRELKAPGNWTNIDFSDPKLVSAIRIVKQQLREQVSASLQTINCHVKKERVQVWDGESIDCYVFRPDDTDGRMPAMLYCHGGGFFLPVQPMMIHLAAQYATELGICVYLPEYRLLPEHPNPYPFRDCLSILQWMREREAGEYLLYGESAGGALAAGLALYARDHGIVPARGQCLVYPVLDNRCSRYLSMRSFMDAAWPLRSNIIMWQKYLQNGDADLEEYVIPMRSENVAALPPTYVEPQEIDILRDEAVAYARRLKDAGVDMVLNMVEGSYHGFDADTENEFVKSIVSKRIDVMRTMLAAK